MGIDTDLLKKLMTNEWDPHSTTPVPEHRHLEEFRRKEFEGGDIAERYHENTKYTPNADRTHGRTVSLFVRDDTMQYALTKVPPEYEGLEKLSLPDPETDLDVDLSEALAHRRSARVYTGEGLSRQRLSTLLAHACGVNGRLGGARDGPLSEVDNLARTYPSGGGLYPVEIYFAVLNEGPDLDTGLYYYEPDDHALRVLERGGPGYAEEVAEMFVAPEVFEPASASVCCLLTGAFWRTKAKYGPRAYRFVLQESGHLVQNVLLVATAMGLGGIPIAATYEDQLNEFVDVNGVDEAVVYTTFVGSPRRGGAGA